MSGAGGLRLDPALLRVDPTAFVARGAVVAGDVHLGASSSVWFATVLRGDTDAIRVGARSNIQDGTIVHCDEGAPVEIGEGVTIGHRCIIHGATIGDGSLIGMGATILNHARIGKRCLVGAGALVTQGKEFGDELLILGSPARPVRRLTEDDLRQLEHAAAHYVDAGAAWRARGWHEVLRPEGGA